MSTLNSLSSSNKCDTNEEDVAYNLDNFDEAEREVFGEKSFPTCSESTNDQDIDSNSVGFTSIDEDNSLYNVPLLT